MGEFSNNFFQSNDLNLHYINYKTNAHKPLIMLHGMRSYAQSWNDVADQLLTFFDVYALDQRGRGESDWAPDYNYDTESYVDDLTNFHLWGIQWAGVIVSFLLQKTLKWLRVLLL